MTIDWRSISYVNGLLLLALSGAMLIPMLADFLYFGTHTYTSFIKSIFTCLVIGGALVLANQGPSKVTLGMREAFLVTSLVWVVLSVFSALPIHLSLNISFTDALFESVSALSTTGMTIFASIENVAKPVLLWRSMLQWFGGIGIIVMAMTFFPALRLGGMQLFRSEFSDRYEKILPRLSQISSSLLSCYCFFTILCGVLYYFAGMTKFDALCHALCTISTGGLSTHTDSFAYFNNGWIDLIACIFMIIGSSTLIVFVRAFHGDWRSTFKDSQLHSFLKIIVLIATFITLWQLFKYDDSFFTALRQSFFMTISMISTTGYTNTDIWSPLPLTIFFTLGLIGGCTGSTSGGIKIFRLQVLFSMARNHLRLLRRPNAVFITQFQGYKITDAVAFSVLTLIVLYISSVIVISLLLSSSGFDFTTAISGAGAVLGTHGVAMGSILGPSSCLTNLDAFPKFTLMFGMICGRLEILTLLILFMPSFWRD